MLIATFTGIVIAITGFVVGRRLGYQEGRDDTARAVLAHPLFARESDEQRDDAWQVDPS